MARFPFYKQAESKDCGPTCLKIIAKHYGKLLSIQQLRKLSETTREGTNLLGLSEAAEELGFRTLPAKLSYNILLKSPLPCILHWTNDHYVVVYKTSKRKASVSDPSKGLLTYSREEFIQNWIGNNATEDTKDGIVLLLEPTPKFYQTEFIKEEKFGLSFILKYLLRYQRFIFQLLLGLLTISLLQLIVPFLTQGIVDVGIKNQDLNFIYLILLAQLFLYLGKASLEVIKSWILLHLTTRVNISLVSDFFIKLMKLPISYFDVKMTGDLLQRINDHNRIEQVLTTTSLSTLFSMFNFVIFSLVLIYYNIQIFFVFLIGSVMYVGWILFFFKKRKVIDNQRFAKMSEEQSKVIELINGMQEIKLHNAERRMRWRWEYIQATLFRIDIKNLKLEQTQSIGSNLINEIKNMFVTVLSAKLVIDGGITLGMMLAITYIVGQLDAPITNLIHFLRNAQDARISIERLGEVHNMKDEESDKKSDELPSDASIKLGNISFRYIGNDNHVIHNLSLTIPQNKVTAIVGESGSGKTTMMKLLLKFYDVNDGEILVGNQQINNISQKAWRDACGTVMQEGFIFNTTIAENIAVGETNVDKKKLISAAQVANIYEFIQELPLNFNTKIGSEGLGLSTGQKQRLLIARAVYKNPHYLFFDEATSALDANNEKAIINNLFSYFKEKTVVVIAHRLSTVKNADKIVVLEKGRIIEEGDHKALIRNKGKYYSLVQNQLELG